MTFEEKQTKVNEAIERLGLTHVFCNYENAYPSHNIKAGFFVGTENTDDGEKFPPDSSVEEMVQFVKDVYRS